MLIYKVTKCIYPRKNNNELESWIIESEGDYPYYINKFIHQMSFSSANTAKQYAYKLCSYLNYLHNIWKVNYIEAETKHLKSFI